jgi:hypothetical protein
MVSNPRKKYQIEANLNENLDGVDFLHGNMMKRVLEAWKGKPLLITLEKMYNRRSDKQNRYKYGVIIPCIRNHHYDTTGERLSVDGAQMLIYNTILGNEIVFEKVYGLDVPVLQGKRMSKMDTVEFNDAKEKIQLWGDERDCHIPDPIGNNLVSDFINYKW